VTLSEWLAAGSLAQCRVLHPRAEQGLLDGLFADQPIALLIGSEGGFSETEIRQMQSANVTPVHLGRRILRTETASPAAIAALQFHLGDMG